jgi:hypothetical protein
MKVKCVNATKEKFKLFGANEIVPAEGLTEGRIYDAQALMEVSGGGNMSVDTEVQFLIFNDLGKWETYKPDNFVPADYVLSEDFEHLRELHNRGLK